MKLSNAVAKMSKLNNTCKSMGARFRTFNARERLLARYVLFPSYIIRKRTSFKLSLAIAYQSVAYLIDPVTRILHEREAFIDKAPKDTAVLVYRKSLVTQAMSVSSSPARLKNFDKSGLNSSSYKTLGVFLSDIIATCLIWIYYNFLPKILIQYSG